MPLYRGCRLPLLGRLKHYPKLTAITTAPGQTVQIYEWNAAAATIIRWGDGETTTHPANTSSVINHTYAAAGTYTITLRVAQAALTKFRVDDAKIGLDTVDFAGCVNLTYFRISTPGVSKFDSAHLASRPLTYFLLASLPAGSTVNFDSADLASMPLTIFYLANLPAGSTVNFDSADLASMPLTIFYLANLPAGSVITVAAADFDGWPAATTVAASNNALSQVQVDAILEGLYTGLSTRTATAGTINVGGTNAAPSGVYQAQCPPTTGKERAYELLNDSCLINPTKKWATVTITA